MSSSRPAPVVSLLSLLPEELAAQAVAMRQEIHRHPELSHQEFETQALLETALRHLGLTPVRVGGTGLYADIVGDRTGPTVCIRGDMDGLPVTEVTGLPYSSTNPGVMHACGHDIHAAGTWAAAALLVEEPPSGTVRIFFQPAEERGTGAAMCVADGVMEGVDAVIGGHVDLEYPLGFVAIQPGIICASTDQFRIRLNGRGGHAARPHQANDALLAGAHLVVALQQIVSREIAPGLPAVVSVARFASGERHNVLSGSAELEGTLRAQDPAVRNHLREALRRVTAGIAEASDLRATTEYLDAHDPIVNDVELSSLMADTTRCLLGSGSVGRLRTLNMGGEDFSTLQRGRRGVYVRWGGAGGASAPAPAHSSRFHVDDQILAVVAATQAANAMAIVEHLRHG